MADKPKLQDRLQSVINDLGRHQSYLTDITDPQKAATPAALEAAMTARKIPLQPNIITQAEEEYEIYRKTIEDAFASNDFDLASNLIGNNIAAISATLNANPDLVKELGLMDRREYNFYSILVGNNNATTLRALEQNPNLAKQLGLSGWTSYKLPSDDLKKTLREKILADDAVMDAVKKDLKGKIDGITAQQDAYDALVKDPGRIDSRLRLLLSEMWSLSDYLKKDPHDPDNRDRLVDIWSMVGDLSLASGSFSTAQSEAFGNIKDLITAKFGLSAKPKSPPGVLGPNDLQPIGDLLIVEIASGGYELGQEATKEDMKGQFSTPQRKSSDILKKRIDALKRDKNFTGFLVNNQGAVTDLLAPKIEGLNHWARGDGPGGYVSQNDVKAVHALLEGKDEILAIAKEAKALSKEVENCGEWTPELSKRLSDLQGEQDALMKHRGLYSENQGKAADFLNTLVARLDAARKGEYIDSVTDADLEVVRKGLKGENISAFFPVASTAAGSPGGAAQNGTVITAGQGRLTSGMNGNAADITRQGNVRFINNGSGNNGTTAGGASGSAAVPLTPEQLADQQNRMEAARRDKAEWEAFQARERQIREINNPSPGLTDAVGAVTGGIASIFNKGVARLPNGIVKDGFEGLGTVAGGLTGFLSGTFNKLKNDPTGDGQQLMALGLTGLAAFWGSGIINKYINPYVSSIPFASSITGLLSLVGVALVSFPLFTGMFDKPVSSRDPESINVRNNITTETRGGARPNSGYDFAFNQQ